jgi:hypothetical protein
VTVLSKRRDQEKEIRQRLHELRRSGREQYLKLMDIDVPEVRELEKKLDAQYEELTSMVKGGLKDSGKQNAEQHGLSFDRACRVHEKTMEKMIDLSQDLPTTRPPLARLYCFCFPWKQAGYIDHDHSVVIDPPSGGTGSGSVTFEATGCVAHPYAEAKGGGTGSINSVEVKAWCKYAFMPPDDGYYCISPTVFMNGHMLLWTWGTCGGTPEDLGIGSVEVNLNVRVDQLSATVKTLKHEVLDESKSAGHNINTGWHYDSTLHGGAQMSAYLEGNHEAVVFVECESRVEIANHGRVWVDMQTSPHFYFKVPEVRWGRVVCLPYPLYLMYETVKT